MEDLLKEPQPQTLELIRTGKLIYLPDLTDPNTIDPNELVFGLTKQPSGLVDTQEFFSRLSPEIFTSVAPVEIAGSYAKLNHAINQSTGVNPAQIFLNKANYPDFIFFSIFMTTGKIATQNDLALHLSIVKKLENQQGIHFSPEDKLVTLPAAMIGFAVTDRGGGKDGVNHVSNFSALISQLTQGDLNGLFSPLCAQYDARVEPSGSIINYRIKEQLAVAHTQRSMDWMNMLSFIAKLKKPEFNILWSTLTGDADHIGSIVPRVISYHAQRQEIARMFLTIDRQFHHLEALTESTQSGIEVTNLTAVENFVDETLENMLGPDWQRLTESDLLRMIDSYESQKNQSGLSLDEQAKLQLMYLTRDEAYPTIRRFINTNRNVRETLSKLENLDDDLAALTPQEWQEWSYYRGFNPGSAYDDARSFFDTIRKKVTKQSEVTAVADALHEVILYFALGKFAGINKYGVVGLDIDHDPYMTIAWELGWQSALQKKASAPIAYARNVDTGSADKKFAGMDYNQLYLRAYQQSENGVQRLSTTVLREPWIDF